MFFSLDNAAKVASAAVTASEAFGYQRIARPLLFRKDPEEIHNLTIRALASCSPLLGNFGAQISSNLPVLRVPDNPVRAGGVDFRHPVILAAGLDKTGEAARMWSALGFAGAELGTFTPRPQPGNPAPRMFRMPQDRAIINRMGFNNPGAAAGAGLLRAWGVARGNNALGARIGMSIGKNKTTPNEDFIADYVDCLREVSDVADYAAINVSSPNTPGLRDLQDPAALRDLLQALNEVRAGESPLPLWLKIAPDMGWLDIDGILGVAEEMGVDAIIATNTTNARPASLRSAAAAETGGLSGAPLTLRSLQVIRYVAAHSRVDVVGSGGIMTAADAAAALDAGAKAIQLYTGFIYRGPALIREIAAL